MQQVTRHLRLSNRPELRSALRSALVLWLVVQISGCAPVYRAPNHADLHRVEPSKHEIPDQPIVQPPGLPLPEVPPVVDASAAGFVPLDPNAEPQERPLTLEEAIQISLANSGVVRVLNGGDVSAVAATPYDPHIADARLRAAVAAFDPSLTTALYANWINQPPEAVFGPGLAEPTFRDEAGFAAAVSKPWVTGAETRIGYNPPLGYLYIPDPSSGSLNPLYTSNLEFLVRQPFLRGAGTGVNKAPIRIAQIRRDQSSLETRQAVMASVRSVTEAYWELFAARNAAQVLHEVVPLLQRVAQIEHERMQAQRSIRADVAKAHSELHGVRLQLVELRGAIVQRELRLRNLLGLPPSDGYTLVPTSQPLQAPVILDPAASITMAQENRPDLQRQQLAVRTRENELILAKNYGLPQLDASVLYRWNGVGNALDDSMSQMLGTKYQDWQTSMTLTVPLGRRAGAAGIRAATLQLARERAMMQQALHAVSHQITSLIQEAAYTHELYREADARWQANTVWLEGSRIRYENPPPSGDDWLLAATNDYLSAVRSQADAARNAQSYLSRYNALLARINEARGTILYDSNLSLVDEGPNASKAEPNPAGLPSMLPLPPATTNDLPLMPLNELSPLPTGEPAPPPALPPELNTPSVPNTQTPWPPMAPPSSPPVPPPSSLEVNVIPAAPAVGVRTSGISEADRPSALYPRKPRSTPQLASRIDTEAKPEPSLNSSQILRERPAGEAMRPPMAKVRAVGVQPTLRNEQNSLIVSQAEAESMRTSAVRPIDSPTDVAKIRPLEPSAIQGDTYYSSATEVAPMSAHRSRLGPADFFEPAPVRR